MRPLNLIQQAYAQIEKETLAIVFGCKQFHQYILGKNITIESDHKRYLENPYMNVRYVYKE